MTLFKLEEADKNWLEAVAKADAAVGVEALAVAKRDSVAVDSAVVAVAMDEASVLVEASVLLETSVLAAAEEEEEPV
jgi:hypothetical protein